MKLKTTAAGAALLLAISLAGCSSPTPQAEPMATQTTAPEPAETTEPAAEPTEEPAADVGTRDNPVPIGEVLALSSDSAFKVGASGATQVSPGYSVLPLVVQIDWSNVNAQAAAQGQQGMPVNLWGGLGVSFVTADGRTYDSMDDYTVTIPDTLFDIGDVYEGTDVVNANVAVSVPEAEVPGGAWVVENWSSGARVFLATE